MDIYREEILEHWRNPQNFGQMKHADKEITQFNPLCGDQVTFYFRFAKRTKTNGTVPFRIEENTVIEGVSFTGNGCAISIASASILSDFIKGKRISTLAKIRGQEVLELMGPSASSGFPPARLKCAFLALEAIRKLKN